MHMGDRREKLALFFYVLEMYVNYFLHSLLNLLFEFAFNFIVLPFMNIVTN